MKKRTLRYFSLVAAGTLAITFSGCGGSEVTYVDPYGANTMGSLNQITIQDWNMAADDLVADLLSSGVINTSGSPMTMAVSRVKNDTQSMVDTDSLTKKIRMALNNSGTVITSSTMGYGGRVDDPMAQEAAQMQAFMGGEPQETELPDFTLSGKLLQDSVRDGSTRQVSFIFQLSLTRVSDGLAIWEGEKIISKQGSRPAVSW